MIKSSEKKASSELSWLQHRLEHIWYHSGGGVSLLKPLEGVYRVLAKADRWRSQKKQIRHPLPIIIVGNISVGGTGKTPLVIYLVAQLQQAGYRPAIITRGYAGKLQHWPVLVTPTSDPSICGDEPVLMAQRSGVCVIAGPDRNADIEYLLQNTDCNIVISDDGLQHYKLKRDIEIAVIDGQRRLGNECCLPAGPLREPASRLAQCDFVVVNEASPSAELSMQLIATQVAHLTTDQQHSLSTWKGRAVHAVTGIGNPSRFFDTLRREGLEVIEHIFPDHHPFHLADITFADQLPVMMTEKDAVKCRTFANDQHWYVPVTANVNEVFAKELLARLGEIAFENNKP